MLRPWRCIAALLVCHLVSCAWETTQNQEHSSTAEDLISWLRASGGVAHLEVKPVTDTGLRGTLATQDIAEGEPIVLLPHNLTIDIADYTYPGAELAVALYRKLLSDPALNASFAPYWASLPLQGTLYSKEVWNTDPDHLSLLQNDYMASYAATNALWTISIWEGTAELDPERMFPDLTAKGLPGADKVTLDEFKHWAALTATYSFVFPNAEGKYQRVLLPLLDLVNHKGEGANSHVYKDETTGDYRLVAARDIRKGEEVTHTYNWDNERMDYSLINYFFIPQHDVPRLAAMDLIDGHLDGGFGEVDEHYLPRDKHGIQAMGQALEERLAAFASSEEEDERMLASHGATWDWRDRRVVEFRKERKRAIRLTLERLREAEKTAYRLLTTPIASHGGEEL